MKIGIITFWDSNDNYGQLMQSFALQAYLRSKNHDAYIIKYKPSRKKSRSFDLGKLSPVHIFRYLKFRFKRDCDSTPDIIRDFSKFRTNISYSEKTYYGFEELAAENWNDTDAFICGSDQIWSPKPDEQLKSYFLKFAPFNSRHISYAPSFGGKSLPEEYECQLHELLSGFDALSVREKEGVEIVKAAGYSAKLVCDPTLLLRDVDYLNKLGLQKNPSQSIFCYMINWDTAWDEEELISFSKSREMKINLFSTIGFPTRLQLQRNQTPENWLTQLSSAHYSVVNSFHGLVFSLIFHIPFAVYLLKGTQAAMNGRIHSLLEIVNLADRIASRENPLEEIFNREINWKEVDDRLDLFRSTSLAFLESALTDKTVPTQAPQNILFMTNGCVHHCYGGLDRVTELLADQFAQDGHNVKYLSYCNRGRFDSARQFFFPHKEISHPENASFLGNFVKDNNIDIIINQEGNVNICRSFEDMDKIKKITCLHFNPNYIDDNYFKTRFIHNSLPVRRIASVLFKIPFVNRWGLNHLRNKLGEGYDLNLEWCDKYVLLSSYFNPVITGLSHKKDHFDRLEAINNPLSIDDSPESTVENKEKLIIFVGRLDNNFKNIDFLIDSITPVLKDNPDWRFVICGDGPDREWLMKLAATNSDGIEFAGYCNPVEYYKKASIIVLSSSSSEGWGMVLTEAMSYGVVPVVTNTYASIPDIISDGKDGVITEKNSLKFSSAILELIKDSQKLSKMGQNARYSSNRFNVKTIATQWYRLFHKCCSH